MSKKSVGRKKNGAGRISFLCIGVFLVLVLSVQMVRLYQKNEALIQEEQSKQEELQQQQQRQEELSEQEQYIQSDEYKESVLPKAVRKRVAIEALSEFGWGNYVGLDGAYIGMKTFGASGPAAKLFEKFGFTVENVVATVKSIM